MKKSILLACTVLAAFSASTAVAYDPRTQYRMRPTIEINLDALNNLAHEEAPVPVASGAADTSPFGQQSEADKKRMKKPHRVKHHKKHHVKHHKKPATACPPLVPEKAQTTPEVKVTADKTSNAESENVPQLAQLPGHEPAAPAISPEPAKHTPDVESLPPAPAASKQELPASPKEKPLALPEPVSVPAPAASLPPLPAASGATKVLSPNTAAEPPVIPSAALPDKEMSTPPSLPPLPGDKGAVKELQPVGGATPPALPPLPGAASDKGAEALPPLPGAPAAGVAAAPKATGAASMPDEQIVFSSNETELPLAANAKLDMIAAQLAAHPNMRASIVAYASGSDAVSIYPKRVSLARGIAVRNYLVSTKNIDVERVTVKALGNKNESGPADRVDVFLIK